MFTQEEQRLALVGLRHRLRLTQLDVAKHARVNRSSLSLWEHGFASLPTEILDRIQDYLTDELVALKAIEAEPVEAVRYYVPLSAFGSQSSRRLELEN